MAASHLKNDTRISVLADIWEDQLISPYLFDANVTDASYLHTRMLQTLMDFIGEVLLQKRINCSFNRVEGYHILI